MTHPNYERDRAEAQAEYNRLMLDTARIVAHVRAPQPAPPTLWKRICAAWSRARALTQSKD